MEMRPREDLSKLELKSKQVENIEVFKKIGKDIGSFCLGLAQSSVSDLFILPTSLRQELKIWKKGKEAYEKDGDDKLTAYEFGRISGFTNAVPFFIHLLNAVGVYGLCTSNDPNLGYALLGTEMVTNITSLSYEVFKDYKKDGLKKNTTPKIS